MRRRALLLVPRLPGTGHTGDRVRTRFHLAALSRAGFDVVLVGGTPHGALPPPAGEGLRVVPVPLGRVAFVAALARAAATGLPLQTAFAAGNWNQALASPGSDRYDLVVVLLARLWPLVASRLPAAPLVVDYVDALSEAARQASAVDPSALRRLYWRADAPRLARAERDAARRASLLLATTATDAAALPKGTIGLPHGVPIGPEPPAGPRPPVVAFTGRLSYRPNEVGVRRLVESIWPAVRAARPEARLVLAGADAPGWISRLDGRDGITVLSPIPDIPALLRRALVAAAPLTIGTGTPNKLFEALEAGTPFVAAPELASRAAAAVPPPVRVARTDAEFSAGVVELLGDPDRAAREGAAGRLWVEEYASRDAAVSALALLLSRAAETHA